MAFVQVQGKVSRVFFDGKGAEIVESFTVKGEARNVRWSCWFAEPHGLEVDAQVEVSGLHSDAVDEWTDKESAIRHTVKRSINSAKVKVSPPADTAEAAFAPNDETPF